MSATGVTVAEIQSTCSRLVDLSRRRLAEGNNPEQVLAVTLECLTNIAEATER